MIILKRILPGLIVGSATLWWFLDGLEWSKIGQELQELHFGWVIAATLILLGEFVIRAWRWKILLRPMGMKTKGSDLFIAQICGAAVNTLLPLRFGEIAKPWIAARRTGHRFISVAATAVMERVYDLLGMVSVLVIMVLFLSPKFSASGEQAELISNLKVYGGLAGIISVVSMLIFFVLISYQNKYRWIFVRITSVAPQPVQEKFLELFDGFVSGLGNAKDQAGLWQSSILSVWMWLNGALAIYCLFLALGLELPFGAACFVGVAIALTVALPQAPGFIGVFHVAMEKTLLLWGADPAQAQSFAIIFWAVSFLPVTLLGSIALLREGVNLSTLREKALQSERKSDTL